MSQFFSSNHNSTLIFVELTHVGFAWGSCLQWPAVFKLEGQVFKLEGVIYYVDPKSSSETQGQSGGSGERARWEFSSTGERAPAYQLSPNYFQNFKQMPAPDWAQKMLCIIVPNWRTVSPEFLFIVLSRHSKMAAHLGFFEWLMVGSPQSIRCCPASLLIWQGACGLRWKPTSGLTILREEISWPTMRCDGLSDGRKQPLANTVGCSVVAADTASWLYTIEGCLLGLWLQICPLGLLLMPFFVTGYGCKTMEVWYQSFPSPRWVSFQG